MDLAVRKNSYYCTSNGSIILFKKKNTQLRITIGKRVTISIADGSFIAYLCFNQEFIEKIHHCMHEI